MKKVYAGQLEIEPYGFLSVRDELADGYPDSLADRVTGDWTNGNLVAVRYYVSDIPMTEEEAVERLIATVYGGDMDARYRLEAYSEYTVLEWEEGLRVGGHDLIQELTGFIGKYVVLVIESADNTGV